MMNRPPALRLLYYSLSGSDIQNIKALACPSDLGSEVMSRPRLHLRCSFIGVTLS